ncbi:MAG: hypothetical protein CL608_28820 [Anaerolineaceae bacterium]|nr:hypothetical protein [Anaerolineaceae bacterium]
MCDDLILLAFGGPFYFFNYRILSLLDNGIDLSDSLPEISEFLLVNSRNSIAADAVLFVGVNPLSNFGYPEIRAFGKKILAVLAEEAPKSQHICITIHGANYGLDEVQALEAEVNGLIDAIEEGEFPRNLKAITIIEQDNARTERLKIALSRLFPDGNIKAVKYEKELNSTIVSLLITSISFVNQLFNKNVDAKQSQKHILKQEFIQDIISQANQCISDLLTKLPDMVEEPVFSHMSETIREIQTQLDVLSQTVNDQALDERESIVQLVVTTLNPFQVSVEVAKLRLHDYEHKEIGWCCYIIGMGTLFAYYDYLEQDIHFLRLNLEQAIKAAQFRILNEVGLKLIPQDEFPWDQVKYLLLLENAEDLLNLYENSGG